MWKKVLMFVMVMSLFSTGVLADAVAVQKDNKQSSTKNQTDYASKAKLVGNEYVYKSKYYTLHAPKDTKKDDINFAITNFNKGIELAFEIYSSKVPDLEATLSNQTDFPTNIYLKNKSDDPYEFTYVNGGASHNKKTGALETEIKILVASLYKGQCCSYDGKFKYDTAYVKNLYIATGLNLGSVIFNENMNSKPSWYSSSGAGEFATGFVNYKSRLASNTYKDYAKYWKNEVKKNNKLLVLNNGDFDFKYSTNVATLFNAFLIEIYGEDTYFEFVLFESDTISKKEAFLATYGDIKEIEKKWKAWINK